MAGELRMVERDTQKSLMAEYQWRWRAQYARYFSSYPSCSHRASTKINNNSLNISSISTVQRKRFIPTWLPSIESFNVCLHPSDHSPQLSVLTVSYLDTVLEEHRVSKLHFVWPQVACVAGFPARGSLFVIASYIDNQDERQKFALRFSTPSEIENFVTSMEDILSNKFPTELSALDMVSPVSSQSEFIPPYRPDKSSMIVSPIYASSEPTNCCYENQQDSEFQTQDIVTDSESNAVVNPSRCTSVVYRLDGSSMIMSPIYASSEPTNFHHEIKQESQFQTQDIVTDSESNGVVFPPRFTSLVSSCSTDEPGSREQSESAVTPVPQLQEPDLKSQIAKYMQDASFLGELALTIAPELQEPDLKSQIAKYMQDASFLDMMSKVNEVVTELGGDFVI